MREFKAIPKKWGNSIGITIPKEVAKEEKIKPNKEITLLVLSSQKDIWKSFGSLKQKKPMQKIMEEIDEGYD